MSARGKFITLEGIDGAGKSTHHAWLVEHLRARGHTVVSTREPGGTPLGEKLRGLLLTEPMHLETEALLMFAARREHIAEVIAPALARGDWVVSDRFTDASFAYQGGGRGLAWEKLAQLEQWVQSDLQPDLTLLFDLDAGVARQRLQGTGNALDRFEREQQAFFERVRAAYHRRAAECAGRFCLIDASQSIQNIQEILEVRISSV
ncbi:dTMP kinase [Denitratisoma sp. DHT3]|uniref:dTMP kinase n=1 Tax=Denitratisoma sp. DHT3 TaxID=1981880 RepID=UPI0011987DEE|nr:dTMP kinase [Denitratisoma sp. DHT3]QDX80437.1 dTMP kinase [Denitratisoma sp. DHT3]